MLQYFATRLLMFIPTVILITLMVFIFMRTIPSDPAEIILTGSSGEAAFSDEDLKKLQHELGLDRPLYVQYGSWIWQLLRGDLGTSYYYNVPISDQLKLRVPLTLEFTFLGIFISVVVAVPLGIISALKQDTIIDYIARIITFIGVAVPNFVTGLVTIYILVRYFNWLPPLVYTPAWEDLDKNLSQLIFPALVMAFFMMAFIARVTRSAMLEVLREDYVRTARAKGLRERRVIGLHALQNAFLPVLTTTGWAFGVFLGGTVIIERIFVLPGMGSLMIDAIFQRDYAVIQAEVLIIALMVLVLNLLVDMLYAWVDPRIRFR